MSANHFDLAAAAFTEMVRQGFHPDFPTGTEEQLAQIRALAPEAPGGDVQEPVAQFLGFGFGELEVYQGSWTCPPA